MNNKEQEINNIEYSEDVAQALVDIMQGEDPEDISQLVDWMAYNDHAIEKLKNLTDESYLDNLVEKFNRPEKENKVKEFQLKLNRIKRKRLTLRIVSVAAAVLSISMLIYVQIGNNENKIVSENSDKKSTNIDYKKPTLVTSIGKTTIVDEDVTYAGSNDIVDISSLVKDVNSENSSDEKLEKVKKVTKFNRYIVPAGYSSNVSLIDGTVVYLNAGSELTFPDNFDGDVREVTLIGEGYFIVSKSNKKFIVSTQDLDINVYGTEFNVNTFSLGGIEVYLKQGSIGVTKKGDSKDVIMKPKHLFKMLGNGSSIIEKVENGKKFIGWMDGYFIFDKTPIKEVVEELSRWYGIEINIEYLSKTEEVTITGSFKNSAKCKDIIKSIESITNIKLKTVNLLMK